MKPTVLKGALTSALTPSGILATKGESFAAQHHREGSGNMIKKLLAVFALVLASITFSPANATNQLATAIGGHDAVAYFEDGAPKPGKARFNHFWNGAVWFFSSEENRDTFSADPTAYAPQYDGYCAWAASQNYKRPGDPNVWQIVDGKLYLMVHEGAREKWRADIPKHIAQGDENWVRIAPY